MNKHVLILFLLIGSGQAFSQEKSQNDYPKSLANYSDFKNLVQEVENYRKKRLINLETFLKMSKEKKVVILDTRSALRYQRKHLKGAIHLNFSDFTQENLWELIPDPNTKILIYCNNNFNDDQINFTTKIVKPSKKDRSLATKTETLVNRKFITLALNIPTFINLYGYGYKNVYELDELVNVNDSRLEFEGSEVNQ